MIAELSAKVPGPLQCHRERLVRMKRQWMAGFGLTAVLACALSMPAARAAVRGDVPAKLSDQDYWKLINDFSEANGYFRSDNLLSNEIWFQYIVPELVSYLKPGGVYLGVGPEQNFTYIAALKPRMVFIVDIRRGNLHTQMMYKALFELSNDRADFVSLLFSRKRPEGLTATSSVQEIFSAVAMAPRTEETYKENFKKIVELLTKKHNFALVKEDIDGIDYVYGNFYTYGPSISYNSSQGGGGRGNMSTYATLMTATDGAGQSRSYLANETLFGVLKDLEMKNLVVPVVGDFAGPKALRSVGKYIKEQGATVTRVLPVQRRAVPPAERRLAVVLQQRRQPAADRSEHVHLQPERRRWRWWRRSEFLVPPDAR